MAARLCDCCGRQSADVKVCAKCKVRAYCSKDCQVQDWKKRHKKECPQLQAGMKPAIDPEAEERTRFPQNTHTARSTGTKQAQQQALAMAMFHGEPPGADRWSSERTPYTPEQGAVLNKLIQLKTNQDWEGAVRMEEEAMCVGKKFRSIFPQGWIAILSNLAVCHEMIGHYEHAKQLNETQLAFCREIGDRKGEAMAHGNVANCLTKTSRFPEAIRHYEAEVAIAVEVGSKMQEGRAHGNLGLCYEKMGLYQKADAMYVKHLELAIESNDRLSEGCAYCNIGNAAYRDGDYKRGIELHTKHLNISREVGDKANEARALTNLGKCRGGMGDYEKSGKLLEARLKMALDAGDKLGQGLAYANLSTFYLQQGMFKEAVQIGEARLALGREMNDQWAICASLYSLARIRFSSGNEDQAVDLLQQHLQVHVVEIGRSGCLGCGQVRGGEVDLLTCGGCGAGRYCNKAHQKMAWNGDGMLAKHKDICPMLKLWRQVVKGKVSAEDCREQMLEYLGAHRVAPVGLVDRDLEICPLMAHVLSERGQQGRIPKCLEPFSMFPEHDDDEDDDEEDEDEDDDEDDPLAPLEEDKPMDRDELLRQLAVLFGEM